MAREITAADIEFTKKVVRSMPCAYRLGIEDAIAEGLLGLWKAVLSFDQSHGATFRSHAHNCIVRAVLDASRGADHLTRWHRGLVKRDLEEDTGAPLHLEGFAALFDSSSASGVSYWNWETVIASETDDGDIALRLTVDEAVQRMEGQRGAVLRLWMADVPRVDIGDFFSVSASRVSQILRAALDELGMDLAADSSVALLAA